MQKLLSSSSFEFATSRRKPCSQRCKVRSDVISCCTLSHNMCLGAVREATKPRSGLSRQESFQYLITRFERNDPLVVKPRHAARPETEIHCPGGRVWGRFIQRLKEVRKRYPQYIVTNESIRHFFSDVESRECEHEIRSLIDSSVHTMTSPRSLCSCLPFRKKSNKLEVR